jgi:hypothetical protein
VTTIWWSLLVVHGHLGALLLPKSGFSAARINPAQRRIPDPARCMGDLRFMSPVHLGDTLEKSSAPRSRPSTRTPRRPVPGNGRDPVDMGILHAANVVALPIIGRLLTTPRRRGGDATAGVGSAPTTSTPPLGPGTWVLRIEPAPDSAQQPPSTRADAASLRGDETTSIDTPNQPSSPTLTKVRSSAQPGHHGRDLRAEHSVHPR